RPIRPAIAAGLERAGHGDVSSRSRVEPGHATLPRIPRSHNGEEHPHGTAAGAQCRLPFAAWQRGRLELGDLKLAQDTGRLGPAVTGAALPFGAWRDELEAELTEAQQAIAEALADLLAAEAAHEAAREQHQTLRDAIAVLRPPVASAIAQRVRFADEALHDAAGGGGRGGGAGPVARGAVAGRHDRRADLEQPLRELAHLTAAAAVGEEKEQADAAVS